MSALRKFRNGLTFKMMESFLSLLFFDFTKGSNKLLCISEEHVVNRRAKKKKVQEGLPVLFPFP